DVGAYCIRPQWINAANVRPCGPRCSAPMHHQGVGAKGHAPRDMTHMFALLASQWQSRQTICPPLKCPGLGGAATTPRKAKPCVTPLERFALVCGIMKRRRFDPTIYLWRGCHEALPQAAAAIVPAHTAVDRQRL